MLRVLKLLVVLGLVLAVPFASASALPDWQTPPTPAERLQQAGGKTEIVWDQTTGVPVFISTDLPAPNRAVAQPEVQARSFFAAYSDLYRMQNPPAELALDRVESDKAGMQHVRFKQVVNDVPVFGGQLIVHLQDGGVRAVNGNYFPDVKVDTTPAFSQDAAVALVRADVGDPQAELRAERSGLVVYVDEGHPHLAWKIDLYSEKNLGDWLYFVDAHDNRIVHKLNQLDTVKSLKVYDMNHNSSGLPGTLVCGTGAGNALCGDPADLDAQGAYTNTSKVYDYYKNVFGRLSFDNLDTELRSSVHFGSNYYNAFWNGEQMVYGDADTFAQAFDVIAHELTHGVTQYTSDLIYEHQSGALNESWSDVMAVFAGCSIATGLANCNWVMGDTLLGGAIRDLSNPPAFGDPDNMSNYRWLPLELDNGGVHINSGIPNKAAYLLAHGDVTTTIGIGTTKAEQIYYRAMKNYLTTYSDFSVARAALYQSCHDLIGSYELTSVDCDQVQNAWAAVGVGSPAVTIPSGYTLYLPAVTRGYLPVSCSPSGILANGNFEAGAANWTESSAGGFPIIGGPPTGVTAHDGTKLAWLGGYDNAVDLLYQTINIPAGRTAMQVSFYVKVGSQDSATTPYDKLYASIQPVNSVTLPQIWIADNTLSGVGWMHVTLTYNELPYAGQAMRLFLRATTDDMLNTNFFVDTASLQVACSRYPSTSVAASGPSVTIAPVTNRPAPNPAAALPKR